MRILISSVLIIAFINSCKIPDNYFDKVCAGRSEFKFDSTKDSPSNATFENNKYLTIPQIGIPSDTFKLRIEGESTGDKVKIFEYSFYKSVETFKIYEFPVAKRGQILFDKTKDNLKDFTTIFDSKEKGKNFIEELENNNILELPNSKDIPSYPPTDEISSYIVIEYSNRCRYNIVWFHDANKPQSNKFKEARDLANFIAYLKKEFHY